MKGVTIVDLSQPIYQGMPVYPGHVKTVIFTNPTHDETRRMKKDFSYECRGLLMSDHGPTHLDAINHLTPDPNAESPAALDAAAELRGARGGAARADL